MRNYKIQKTLIKSCVCFFGEHKYFMAIKDSKLRLRYLDKVQTYKVCAFCGKVIKHRVINAGMFDFYGVDVLPVFSKFGRTLNINVARDL